MGVKFEKLFKYFDKKIEEYDSSAKTAALASLTGTSESMNDKNREVALAQNIKKETMQEALAIAEHILRTDNQ